MIKHVTQAIIEKLPTARITWWREGTLWFFKVKVTEDDTNFEFGTFAHSLGPTFFVEPADVYLRKAQAEEMAQLIHCDYLAAKRKYFYGDQDNIVMSFYALYDHPLDHPDDWVIRRWDVVEGNRHPRPETESIVCKGRKAARDYIQKLKPGATLITVNDPDPSIAEVWG